MWGKEPNINVSGWPYVRLKDNPEVNVSFQEEKQKIDDAISAFIRAKGNGGEIVTGWVLLTTVKHPKLPNSDGYISENSDGLPYHAQLGLIYAGLEEKKNTVFANILRKED